MLHYDPEMDSNMVIKFFSCQKKFLIRKKIFPPIFFFWLREKKIGKHYWEVVPTDCTYDAYNCYVGIAVDGMHLGYHLGTDKGKYIFYFIFYFFIFYFFF